MPMLQSPVPTVSHEVKVGQIWLDLDPRTRGLRELKIEAVDATHAFVTSPNYDGTSIRKSRIALVRFRENRHGYKLVKGVEGDD